MPVGCPQCLAPVEPVSAAVPTDYRCPACGLTFRVRPEELTEFAKLVEENVQLFAQAQSLHQKLEDEIFAKLQEWAEREQEFAPLLQEKSELIARLQTETEQLIREPPAHPSIVTEQELMALSDELEQERTRNEKERRRLIEDMRRLQEDRDVVTEEMRRMEMQMARERAELARQRNELQTVREDIRFEIERIERDRDLGDRLAALRQRYNTVARSRSSLLSPSTGQQSSEQSRGRP